MNKIKSIAAVVTASIIEAAAVRLKAFEVEERATAYISEWFELLVTW